MIPSKYAFSALFALAIAAVVFATAAPADEHDRDLTGKKFSLSGKRQISPHEFTVNIAQKTTLELRDASRVLRDGELTDFSAGLYRSGGVQVGFLEVQRSPLYGFIMDARTPMRNAKVLKKNVQRMFPKLDPKIDRIEKFRSRKGFGKIAFFEVEGTLCIHAAAGYALDNIDGGPERVFDTFVIVTYCDPLGRTDEVIGFLKDIKLVTPADNRAAYALRKASNRRPGIVTTNDPDESISARIAQIKALEKKGLISEEEAEQKIRRIRAE